MSRTVTTSIIVLLACVVSAGGEVNFEEGLLRLKSSLMWSAETNDDHEAHTSSSSSGAEWTYRRTATDGEEPYGPSDWYKGYPDCAGDSQSPIDIVADIQTITNPEEFGLKFSPHVCKSEDLVFEINGHSWEVHYAECSEEAYLTFDGERYNMYQTHFHSPSEHAIGGSLHAAEMHMVHIKEGTDDELLVVGVLFDVSEYDYNVELQPLWDVLRTGETSTDKTFGTSIYDVLPSNPVYSYYMGSLTTPPCTEGVTWIVMNDPVIIGKLQLDEFRTSVSTYDDSKVDEFGNTNRPYKSLNGRDVYLVKA